MTTTREGGNYSDVLPLNAARRDSISNLTSFGWAADKSNAVTFRVAVGCYVNGDYRVCDELKWNKIVNMDKNSVLSRLWTKVHEIFGHCRRPFVLSSTLARLSVSCFVQRTFAIKCQSRQKPNKCKSFLAPFFPGGWQQLFYSRLLARFTVRRLANVVEFCLLVPVCIAWQWCRKQIFA